MINHEETERRTPTKAQIIQVFAFFTFSSSHPESKYIIPLIISEITARTATYLMTSDIRFPIKVIGALEPLTEPQLQPGKSPQSIFGTAKTDW